MVAVGAITFAVFVWWFATGLVFLLVLRSALPDWFKLALAALLVPLSLCGAAVSASDNGIAGAYCAFSTAVALWGAQEIGFLTGFVTGPRHLPCPPGATGWRRVYFAIAAILYHEIALVLSGIALLAVTAGAANQTAAFTYLVLWVMRLSAKLNLFLGVPELHDGMMPDVLGFLRSYFRRSSRPNPFYFVSVLGSALVLAGLVAFAVAPDGPVGEGARAGAWLVIALLSLALLEHGFMATRLPVERLWRWGTGPRERRSTASRDHQALALPIDARL